MRAAWYEANGGAAEVLKVGEMDDPAPGPGEVRVRLAVSGVNPSDTKARQGSRKIAWPRIIPHSDGAGVIDMVGAGVDASRVGERVWTWDAQWKRPFGTAAGYTVIGHDRAVRLPDGVSFEAGACLGIPARTGWYAVVTAGVRADDTVFVSGGAGSVSHYAIQFAKARGANVITTVSGEEKARLAGEAGADHVINYRSEPVGERVAAITGGRGADSMIELDLAANAMLIPSVVRPKGTVVVYGTGRPTAEFPNGFCLQNFIAVRFIFVYDLTDAERRDGEAEITAMLEAGRLINNVARTFDLSDIVEAHESVTENRYPGNIVLTV